MSSTVEIIKEKLDIADVIGNYIKLEKAGGSFKAKCPFHNEKTPSFFVSPDRGSYYCFGCGAKGDIFTFTEQFEGVDFVGALKILADKAGVKIEKKNFSVSDKNERFFDVLELATRQFEKNLKGNKEAVEYLKKRGFSDVTIRDFRIGFAPDGWHLLEDVLKNEKVSISEMESVGLIKRGEKGNYDVFRNRIMFPFFDSAGRIIAFSGRILGLEKKDVPKYLNSPETVLFSKSKFLYGFDRAKNKIRIADYSILVEGQADLIMCHQAGFTNTIATSGTALTNEHLGMLKRVSSNMVMCFDADGAGERAAERSAIMAISMGMEIKIAVLPEGHDPASLILESRDKFKEVLKETKHIIDFVIDSAKAKAKDDREFVKIVEKRVLPLVSAVQSSIEKAKYVSKISHVIKVREDSVWESLSKIKLENDDFLKDDTTLGKARPPNMSRKGEYYERRIWGIILWLEAKKKKDFETKDFRERVIKIFGEKANVAEGFYKEEGESLLAEAEAYYGESEKLKDEIEEVFIRAEKEFIQEKVLYLMNEMRDCEEKKDKKKAEEILKKIQELSIKMSALKVQS